MFAFIAAIVKRETRLPLALTGREKFKVQGSKFKVKRKGGHELFMLYGCAVSS
jgi:hypothetical protein